MFGCINKISPVCFPSGSLNLNLISKLSAWNEFMPFPGAHTPSLALICVSHSMKGERREANGLCYFSGIDVSESHDTLIKKQPTVVLLKEAPPTCTHTLKKHHPSFLIEAG